MIGIDKNLLRASVVKESFFEFVKHFWDTVVPEEPVYNWHIEYLCNELQVMAERVFRGQEKEYDLIINIPPGTTKSTICSVLFPPWVMCRMESCRCICGSYAYTLALDLSRKSRMVLTSDKAIEIFPSMKLRDDQNTKGHFSTNAGGGRMAVGTGGSVTGFHAHFIIVDDPLDPLASFSEVELRRANEWMTETLPTRKVDKAVTPTILIQQRLHEDDSTGMMLGMKGQPIKHICLPAEESDLVSPVILKENYKDGLLDPIRMNQKVLDEFKRTLGPYGYAAQFEQSPVPRGGGHFKTERIVIDTSPPLPHLTLCRYWDKAGTRDGGAFTVGLLMGKDAGGYFWVMDVVRGQWDAYEREKIIKQTADLDGPSVMIGIEQEPGSGGKESAQATIRNLAGYKIEADRPQGCKEARAEPFISQVGAGMVKMVRGEWNTDYLNELRLWNRGKYKDQVDASSGAFFKLTKPVRIVGGL